MKPQMELVTPTVERQDMVVRPTRTVTLGWNWYDAPWATASDRERPARITRVRIVYTWTDERWHGPYSLDALGSGVKNDGSPYVVTTNLRWRMPRELAEALTEEYRPTTVVDITETEARS